MRQAKAKSHTPIKSRKQSQSPPCRTHNFTSFKQISRTQYIKSHNSQYEAKPTQCNFIYRHLKNQQIIHVVMSRIFKKPTNIKTEVDMQKSHLFKSRPKTEMSEMRLTNFSGSSKRLIENQQTMKKVQSFNKTLKVFHKSMITNKNRMGLLSKYNNYVKQFEDKLPKDPAQQTRQSIEQNQKLIQICIEDSKAKNKKKQFKQRYQQMLQYSQPVLQPNMKQEFLRKKANSRIRQDLKQIRNKYN